MKNEFKCVAFASLVVLGLLTFTVSLATLLVVSEACWFEDREFVEVSVVHRPLRMSRQTSSAARIPELIAEIEEARLAEETAATEDSEASSAILEPVIIMEYFDVPLSEDLQNYIFKLCEKYDVEPVIVIAMIEKESTYDSSAIGDNGRAYGLMQVQPRWHEERIVRLGVTDLLNPYQNVLVGIDYLAELFDKGNSLEWTLMAYNGGFAHANSYVGRGEVSEYVVDVLGNREELVR